MIPSQSTHTSEREFIVGEGKVILRLFTNRGASAPVLWIVTVFPADTACSPFGNEQAITLHLIDDFEGQDVVANYTQEAANEIYAERLKYFTDPGNRAKANKY